MVTENLDAPREMPKTEHANQFRLSDALSAEEILKKRD